MQKEMIIVCLAIMGVGFLPSLPPLPVLMIILLLAGTGLLYRRIRLLFPLCAGILWGAAYGYLGVSQQLPPALEGVDLWVEGVVSGLPRVKPELQRFELDIEHIELPESVVEKPGLRRVSVNWYQTQQQVRPGERWRLRLKLKRPHGFSNPGGFDYELWLFRQNIGATGYVRSHENNQRLTHAAGNKRLDQWRYKLFQGLSQRLDKAPNKGLLLALLMGERSDISTDQWQLLSATGTNHLFVISGLHVGFVALCGYFIFFHLSRLLLLGPPHIAAQQVGAGGALLISCFYAAMAGFSLPTQRALIMLLMMLLGKLCRRQVSVWQGFTLALMIVLLWDPLAANSAGFWLSFGAVGSLLYAFAQRTANSGFWWRWGRPQWVVFLAFVPVLPFFFQQVSLVSPVANLLAIPFVGFVIVPLCLVVVLLELLLELLTLQALVNAASALVQIASVSLEWIFDYLQLLANLPWAIWAHSILLGSLPLALAGALLLLAPQGLPARWLGWLCFLVLLSNNKSGPQQGQFEIVILDVGQGLAVLVRSAQHQLLYDVGARFSADFDAASAVILPYLRQQNIKVLDRVVISHGDNDHAGSLPFLLAGTRVNEIISGASQLEIAEFDLTPCETGRVWYWDKIRFELMQAEENRWQTENNRSCVLKVSNASLSLLLTGDIEARAEKSLLKQYARQLDVDILVAPHHGSLTSSSEQFLAQVTPDLVIFSSGYRNRFGHPHESIVARYQRRHVEMLNTARQGAIRIYSLPNNAAPAIEKNRQTFKRYWF